MAQPLVSIIIPTYSRPDNLCKAIDNNFSFSIVEYKFYSINGKPYCCVFL